MRLDSVLPMTEAEVAIAVMVLICAAWLVAGPLVGRMAMRRTGLFGAQRATAAEQFAVRSVLVFAPLVSLLGWGALLVLLG